MEPAVLARNVMLFSLIADEYPTKKVTSHHHGLITAVWNIFYHFFIPQSSLDLLRRQATKLLQASESHDLWLTSPYGKFIGFVDKQTLDQLRHYWVRYAVLDNMDRLGAQARTAIANRSLVAEQSNFLQGLRGAGPLWLKAMEMVVHLYRSFWRTGVAGGNGENLDALGNEGRGLINPMFAVSSAPSGDFAVHYGTEPLLGFHVVEAFGEKIGNRKASVTEKADQVIQVAKTQFCDWCRSFKRYLNKDRISINMFCGEALALCRELHLKLTPPEEQPHTSRAYVKPWSSRPLVLGKFVGPSSKHGYGTFDVIDTSNQGDHIGLINVPSAAAPLLRQHASAVLFTESLFVASNSIDTQLRATLCSDVATFSLFLGLVPAGYLAGVTCEAAGHQTVVNRGRGVQQHRMRVAWVSPKLIETTAIPVQEVGD